MQWREHKWGCIHDGTTLATLLQRLTPLCKEVQLTLSTVCLNGYR